MCVPKSLEISRIGINQMHADFSKTMKCPSPFLLIVSLLLVINMDNIDKKKCPPNSSYQTGKHINPKTLKSKLMQALTVMLTGNFKALILSWLRMHLRILHLFLGITGLIIWKQRDKLSNITLKHQCCMFEIGGEVKTKKLWWEILNYNIFCKQLKYITMLSYFYCIYSQ